MSNGPTNQSQSESRTYEPDLVVDQSLTRLVRKAPQRGTGSKPCCTADMSMTTCHEGTMLSISACIHTKSVANNVHPIYFFTNVMLLAAPLTIISSTARMMLVLILPLVPLERQLLTGRNADWKSFVTSGF